jgi:stage II sporulation protein D
MPRRRASTFPGLTLLLTSLVVGGCVAASAPGTIRPAAGPAGPGLAIPSTIRVHTAAGVRTIPIEEYVLGTALSEVSPVGESEGTTERIFEVQAILARTFAAAHVGRHRADGYDLCDTTHCQIYEPARIATSRFSAVARKAVDATRGEVVVYGRTLTEALFHSDCGGHTAAASDVWGGPSVPYLIGEPDDDLPAETHRPWQTSVSATRLRAALEADVRSAIGPRLTGLAVTDRDASGRVATIEVRGGRVREVRGEQFRAMLNRSLGDRTIQSTRFDVVRSGSTYLFTGTGFGHGVGLCQVGAAARARRGDSVPEILGAYFPGTRILQAR